MKIKPTARLIYVLILLGIIAFQSVTIHNLNGDLAEANGDIIEAWEQLQQDQETIKALLINLGAISF